MAVGLVGAFALATPGTAVAHDKGLDHPAPAFTEQAPLSSAINSDTAGEGENLGWELVTTIPTGNPHTDLDFFTQGGESYASVGTLGAGPNGGGQSIIKLTETDEAGEQTVDPSFFSAHPSAACAFIDPLAALGLQHDVEATPKSADVLNNSVQQPGAAAADAQLILDATDAEGRCHDQGNFGSPDLGAPKGGLEIVDITDIEDPVEIGLTSHIGESHTVNVDPRRPHIAYSVTSDGVAVSRDVDDLDGDGNVEELYRQNEDPKDSDRFDLDGFEVVDLSTCMNVNNRATFAQDAEVDLKREGCRPEVFRYRYPTMDMALGHAAEEQTAGSNPITGAPSTTDVYGCHELEIYPDDRLTCGAGAALLTFDMSGAFDDNGTPDDFTDDKPRGQALPCRTRASSTRATAYDTGATITDCVVGGTDDKPIDLTVPNWLDIGAPSLEGVKWTGTVYHQGRGAGLPVTEDIDFNHEAEFTRSGKNLIATDERGGGVTPPGATCSAGDVNQQGNGGIHAYQVDELKTVRPQAPEEAFEAYNVGTDGEKAIFRAPIRTAAEATFCTAHVMQQAPGQNRIFMGWYTQGTQVIDYVELPNGVFEWVENQDAQQETAATGDKPATRAQAETEQAGYFIPENANTWVSHIFRSQENEDGTFTYFGATGDFLLGNDGRNAIDIYKVTLPAPATACTLAPDTTVTDRDAAAEVHRDAIDCILHYGISKGASGGTTYEPLKSVTREQMASFVVNEIKAAGAGDRLKPGGADEFTDIGTSFHRDAINQLQRAGIIQGIGGGAFNPKAQISRQQMATFMVNAARFVTGQPYNAASLTNFSDVPANGIHARNINAGFEAGLFQGTVAPEGAKQGVYSPLIDVRRDQMATFLRNLFLQTIQP